MAKGCFAIYPADKYGIVIGKTELPIDSSDLDKEEAVDIYFAVQEDAPHPLPTDQAALPDSIGKVLRSAQQIYLHPAAGSEARCKEQFRSYYIRLFRLAQVCLEGNNASPEIAQSTLATITADLINDEASRVKNGHLKRLGTAAITMSLPSLIIYLLLRLIQPNDTLDGILRSIGIQPLALANFMLLWVGCFIGVWLSYGIRTTVFTLADLTQADSDYLLPGMRLLFAGMLTMILGIIFMLGVVKISLGSYSITDIGTNSALAFLIGAFCGISELLLPTAVSKQASDFVSKVK